MNAQSLLKGWPGFEKANAETLMASPGWRLETEYAGGSALIRHGSALNSSVDLEVALDGEPHRLRIGDSAAFPDLHRLWERRGDLPENLLLALVGKECGGFLQTLENVARKQLSVKGLAAAAATADAAFVLSAAGTEIPFAIDLTPSLTIEWGRLDNLDVGHPEIRALERPMRVEYATYDISDEERSKLAVGGMLLLPKDAVPSWRLEVPSDDLIHVMSAEESTVTFAQLADEDLPSVPAPAALTIVTRGRVLATAEIAALGSVSAIKIRGFVHKCGSRVAA